MRKFLLRQASPQVDAERSANFRKLFHWLSVVCVMFLLTSCHSTRKVETIPIETIHAVKNRDTIYLHDLCYDSIYVSQDKFIDRNSDTVFIRETNIEYRYKLKRDTILRTQFIERHDSIPYKVIVTQTKEVLAPPTWYDKLAYVSLAILIILAVWKIRKLI